jgi:hypothetical protein
MRKLKYKAQVIFRAETEFYLKNRVLLISEVHFALSLTRVNDNANIWGGGSTTTGFTVGESVKGSNSTTCEWLNKHTQCWSKMK